VLTVNAKTNNGQFSDYLTLSLIETPQDHNSGRIHALELEPAEVDTTKDLHHCNKRQALPTR